MVMTWSKNLKFLILFSPNFITFFLCKIITYTGKSARVVSCRNNRTNRKKNNYLLKSLTKVKTLIM